MSTAEQPPTEQPQWPQLPTIELPPFLEFLKLKNFPLKVYPPVYERSKLTNDTLYIYGPGWRNSWGSFDVQCLQIQVISKKKTKAILILLKEAICREKKKGSTRSIRFQN